MSFIQRFAVSAFVLAGLGACQNQDAAVSFANDIEPILKRDCMPCHYGGGEGSEASGFSVLTYEDVMRGTQYGPVVEPGDRNASSFFRMVAHLTDPAIHMPPHTDQTVASEQMEPLDAEQIEMIGRWIDQGAKNN